MQNKNNKNGGFYITCNTMLLLLPPLISQVCLQPWGISEQQLPNPSIRGPQALRKDRGNAIVCCIGSMSRVYTTFAHRSFQKWLSNLKLLPHYLNGSSQDKSCSVFYSILLIDDAVFDKMADISIIISSFHHEFNSI